MINKVIIKQNYFKAVIAFFDKRRKYLTNDFALRLLYFLISIIIFEIVFRKISGMLISTNANRII